MNGYLIASICVLELSGIMVIILCIKFEVWDGMISMTERWQTLISGKSPSIDAYNNWWLRRFPELDSQSSAMRFFYKLA